MNEIKIIVNKFLNESKQKDQALDQLKTKNLSALEKKVVELLPLLNDKKDILALKKICPDIVKAYLKYGDIE